jgi:hypothetical protein
MHGPATLHASVTAAFNLVLTARSNSAKRPRAGVGVVVIVPIRFPLPA